MEINKFTGFLYTRHFRKNLYKTLEKHSEGINIKLDLKTCDDMAKIVWTFAKTADRKIPSYYKWLDSFNVFPIREIFPNLVKEITKGEVK